MLSRSVTTRLMTPLFVSMLLLAFLALLTIRSEGQVAAANAAAATAQGEVFEFGELRSLSRSLQRDALNLITETDPSEILTIRGKFDDREKKMTKELGALESRLGEQASPDYFRSQRQVIQELAAVAERAGSGDAAGALTQFHARVRPAERAASQIADAKIEARRTDVEILRASAEQASARARLVLLTATLLLAGAGLAAGLVITRRSVVRPLHDLRNGMGMLAAGNIDFAIPHENRADEVGQMARSMAAFRDQLATAERAKDEQAQQIVSSIGSGLEKLAGGDLTARVDTELAGPFAKLQSDFNSAIGALRATMLSVVQATGEIRTGSSEIRRASDDLSRRTEQQAANLEESAAAINEITATIRQSSDGTQQASRTVEEARADALESGAVVRRAVEAMGGIERTSAEISEIISVIDGIAFQTNLLALNAGVEAARAGDAGKGFAVVASEVRALAQRSADAAHDVKARVTASAEQVQTGVELVNAAGEVIERIEARIVDISTAMGRIAEAAEQQAAGMVQVNTAVSEMDGATQQNAAMVEEATAAAGSLATQAETLAREVARFRLGDETADSRPGEASIHHLPASRSTPTPALRRRAAGGRAAALVTDEAGWSEF